ncbi:MAG: hypothetical protein CMP07_11735 [Xanthomonadales bacterium]|nr:hypothetical protein [Xanthomonadales bacterium]|tara:strand:+ start:206 stop:679 length:474 start_codon:yes stop_codon:yes gene_type:complete
MKHDALNLKNLPASRPPDDLWDSIAASLDQAPRRPARRYWRYLPIAAAASLLVTVVTTTLFEPFEQGATRANPELQQARSASARLEQVLRRQRDGLLDATSVESLAWMEQELGWLDMQLADSPSDTRLWQQRANLLAEMASQYQRNNWQTELQLASY